MKIDEMIKGCKAVAVSGHVKPDGDCVGSVLAVYNYIKRISPDIRADMFLEEPDDKLKFLKGFDAIDHSFENDIAYDVMFALDCSTSERLGEAEKIFAGAKHTVCIDHHISNEKYADENYVFGESSSCCEVLYSFMDPGNIDYDVAQCLYTGIISDTGVFKYSSTSPETLRIAARLMEHGLDTNFIIDEAFYAKNWNENRILGYAVMKSKLICEGRIIYAAISLDDMKQFGVTAKELDGIVAQLRLTRGVKCAVFTYETSPFRFKASFRSEAPFDVNKLASVFGGGGHARAAGCTVAGEMESCLEAILIEAAKML